MLAQHLIDTGSVSACTARPTAQQTRGVEPVMVLYQLGNSFNIFTPGDVQKTNVAWQHSQQTRDLDPMARIVPASGRGLVFAESVARPHLSFAHHRV